MKTNATFFSANITNKVTSAQTNLSYFPVIVFFLLLKKRNRKGMASNKKVIFLNKMQNDETSGPIILSHQFGDK